MKLRELLFGSALMSLALITANAAPTGLGDEYRPDFADDRRSLGEAPSGPPPAVPSPLISQDKALSSAYYDTLSILRSNNPCSDFFGGPASADVFNELVSKIRKDSLSTEVGMRMSGATTHVHDARTKQNYRLFKNVYLNSRGSFYRRKAGLWDPTVPKVGTFEPNTQGARVLILLHELGHVIKGSDGRWLLPDDGQNEGQSRANSHKIERVCEEQIHGLGKAATMKDLGKYRGRNQQAEAVSTSAGTQP